MKRYFCNMCDMYPEEAGTFIKLRENVKRKKYEAAMSAEQMADEMVNLFEVRGEEPMIDAKILGTFPKANYPSPEKIQLKK